MHAVSAVSGIGVGVIVGTLDGTIVGVSVGEAVVGVFVGEAVVGAWVGVTGAIVGKVASSGTIGKGLPRSERQVSRMLRKFAKTLGQSMSSFPFDTGAGNFGPAGPAATSYSQWRG